MLTANHVVDRADEVWVTLRDNRRLKAETVGKDRGTDIALLRIPVAANAGPIALNIIRGETPMVVILR